MGLNCSLLPAETVDVPVALVDPRLVPVLAVTERVAAAPAPLASESVKLFMEKA